jgi:DNA integrity scanning protein DisA with diadenylate cyclase activity
VPEESLIESIRLSWRTFADLVALAVVVDSILRLRWLIRAFRIAVMLGFVYAAALVAGHLDLPIAARVLEAWVIFLLCLVAIVFQPEIRRALVKVDAVCQRKVS